MLHGDQIRVVNQEKLVYITDEKGEGDKDE